MKTRIIKSIKKREIDYVFSNHQGGANNGTTKTNRLQKALEKAYEWQNTAVQNTEMMVNDQKYIGPHKYIICLLGDDTYAIN